jgi:hypothetical protein
MSASTYIPTYLAYKENNMSDIQLPESITPYAAAKIISGLEGRVLPPQMFYTYAKKAYIKSFRAESGKIMFKTEDLMDWYNNKYKKSNQTESVEKNEEVEGQQELEFVTESE